jgi:hypothetical protein
VIAGVVVLGIVSAITGGNESSNDSGSNDTATQAAQTHSTSTKTPTQAAPPPTTTAAVPPTTTATAASSGPTNKLPLQDGDWRLDSIRVQDDGLGDFGGTARITYTGESSQGSNIFTATVFVGGKDVAALQGSVNATSTGDTDTVQLISTDPFVGGPYTYDFQAER